MKVKKDKKNLEEIKDIQEYETEYEEKQKRKKFLKKIGIYSLIIVAIIIIILLLKSCIGGDGNNSSLEDKLLKAGKQHFSTNTNLIPSAKGDCTSVSKTTLVEEKLLKESEFNSCDGINTYVKVCRLASDKLHYTPFLACSKDKTSFNNWKEGNENNLVTDKSDVKFTYLGYILDTKNATYGDTEEIWKDEIKYKNYKTLAVTNYYRYRDKSYIWNYREKNYYPGNKLNPTDVKEYYTGSPEVGYDNKDNKTSGVAKWYTETAKEYWNNGAYNATAPEGYNSKESGINFKYYRTRTWTELSTPVTSSPTKYYKCKKTGSALTKYKFTTCDTDTDGYTIPDGEVYSCTASYNNATGGIDTVSSTATCYKCNSGALKSDNSSCGTYGAWGNYTKNACSPLSDTCESKDVTVYKWYKSARSYYPSKSTLASGENTYYLTAPVAGAIKDSSTITTGYKWYKLANVGVTTNYLIAPPTELSTPTSNYKWTSWSSYTTGYPGASLVSTDSRQIQEKVKIKLQKIILTGNESWKKINDGYLEKDELIKKFQTLGFNVTTLDEIEASGEIKYDIKLYYRDRV